MSSDPSLPHTGYTTFDLVFEDNAEDVTTAEQIEAFVWLTDLRVEYIKEETCDMTGRFPIEITSVGSDIDGIVHAPSGSVTDVMAFSGLHNLGATGTLGFTEATWDGIRLDMVSFEW